MGGGGDWVVMMVVWVTVRECGRHGGGGGCGVGDCKGGWKG